MNLMSICGLMACFMVTWSLTALGTSVREASACPDPEQLLSRARAAYDQGDYPLVISTLSSCGLAAIPSAKAQLLLGLAYLRIGEEVPAETALLRARALTPGDAEVLYALAYLKWKGDDPLEAATYAEEAALAGNAATKHLVYAATLNLLAGREAKVVELLLPISDPDVPQSTLFAVAMFRLGNSPDAIRVLAKALTKHFGTSLTTLEEASSGFFEWSSWQKCADDIEAEVYQEAEAHMLRLWRAGGAKVEHSLLWESVLGLVRGEADSAMVPLNRLTQGSAAACVGEYYRQVSALQRGQSPGEIDCNLESAEVVLGRELRRFPALDPEGRHPLPLSLVEHSRTFEARSQ
ncbi:MAG TPA: hypothetical protein VFP98_08065 [Candidatus Polarisedimenticolia bacterium]|nr:hypothetical protein [Candidatus Polarisedimenticolia bacterium]